MNKNSYEQFFTQAREASRPSSPRPKAGSPAKISLPVTPDVEEAALRKALKVKRRKPPFPRKAIFGLVFCLVSLGFYLSCPEIVEHWMSRIEIRTFGQAQAADKETSAKGPAAESSTNSPAGTEKAAATDGKAKPVQGAGEKSSVKEELNQFSKLKQRKEELDEREKELTELEEELQRQKVELDKRIAQLEEMRTQISQTLKERVEVDQEKVNKLVDLYSNMKPKQAADVIGSLNEELAVEVLAKMKKKNAAEVMNLLPPEKARVLSEKYTGYRRISSQEPRG